MRGGRKTNKSLADVFTARSTPNNNEDRCIFPCHATFKISLKIMYSKSSQRFSYRAIVHSYISAHAPRTLQSLCCVFSIRRSIRSEPDPFVASSGSTYPVRPRSMTSIFLFPCWPIHPPLVASDFCPVHSFVAGETSAARRFPRLLPRS